jgi:uncharacterized protein YjbJ (UPF0337 family)
MNWEQIEGKWKQLKGSAKVKWARLTDNDLEFIAGKRDLLVLMIEERYGIAREEVERQVGEWKAACDVQPADRRPARKAG